MGAIGTLIGGLMGGGGPSSAMKFNEGQTASLADTFMANYSTLFGENQSFLNTLKSSYAPLIAAGPSQQGFSSPVLAALNSAALNNSAAANRNAQMQVANYGAARSGDSGLVSGVQKQLAAGV